MSIDPLQEKLADYLGDEMTAAERCDFERELTEHPELEQQAEQLKCALAALRGQWARPRVSPRPRASRWRYAAAALVVFTGGFIVRGFWPGNATAPVAQQQAPRGESAIVEAYLDASADSRFARILMALARHDRPSSESTLD